MDVDQGTQINPDGERVPIGDPSLGGPAPPKALGTVQSPDGTLWRITVDDTGTLETTEVV